MFGEGFHSVLLDKGAGIGDSFFIGIQELAKVNIAEKDGVVSVKKLQGDIGTAGDSVVKAIRADSSVIQGNFLMNRDVVPMVGDKFGVTESGVKDAGEGEGATADKIDATFFQ